MDPIKQGVISIRSKYLDAYNANSYGDPQWILCSSACDGDDRQRWFIVYATDTLISFQLQAGMLGWT